MTPFPIGPLPPIACEPLPDGNVLANVAGTPVMAVGSNAERATRWARFRLRAWMETEEVVAWMEAQG
jgi:hypothetical protein